MTTNKHTAKSRGQRARARMQTPGPTRGGGVPIRKTAKEVMAMDAQGMSTREVATALGVGERYVRKARAYGKDEANGVAGMVFVVPDPLPVEALSEKAAKMLKFSVEGFTLFYETFSGTYLPEHAKNWIQDFIDYRRLVINTAPRMAKSEIMSVWLVIWLVSMNRDHQIIIVSATEALARKFARKIAHVLSTNTDLISTYGRYRPEEKDWPWRPNSGELMVDGRRRDVRSGDYTIQVRGAGQQILGMEATVAIIDDPTNRKVSESPTERQNREEWFRGEVMTRLQNIPGWKSRAVVIGQRVHMKDLYGALSADVRRQGPDTGQKTWQTRIYKAILDWDKKEVLWPARYDEEGELLSGHPFDELMHTYDAIGHHLFNTMFQQDPLAEGSTLVPMSWITGDDKHTGCLDEHRSAYTGYREMEEQFLPIVRAVSVDPSPQRYTGITVADIPYTAAEDFFAASIVECSRQKLGMNDLIKELDRILQQYAPVDYLVFEESTFSKWLYENPYFVQLQQRNDLIVMGHNTTAKSKGDPEMGMWGMSVDFEQGRIRLPWADPESRAMSQLLVEEATTWPEGGLDDILMSLWFLKYQYRRLIPMYHVPSQMSVSRTAWAQSTGTTGWEGF